MFFEKSPLPMWVIDLNTLAFLRVNEAAILKYGYSREEFLAMSAKDIRPAEDVDRFVAYAAVGRDGVTEAGRWRHVLKDGSVIDVDITASHFEFQGTRACIVVVRDVTDLIRTEATTRLQSVALNAAANAIVITDPNGLLLWANRAFTTLTGYTREEARGQSMRALLKSGKQNAELYAQMWDTILAGHTWHGELVNRRKDGSFYIEEQTITPITGTAGEITHFIAVKHDITKRRQLEENLREMQKMEGIGTLVSGIAHDFNNLLMIIDGHAGLIRREPSDAATVRRHAEAVIAAGRRGTSLLDQLRTFARASVPMMEPLSLNAATRDAYKLMSGVIPATIRVSLELEPRLPLIQADSGHLHQVLLNLCLNARDAMGERGTLTISTLRMRGDALRDRFEEAHAPEYVGLIVRDTGCGMSEAVRRRIFEPFFSTKDRNRGSGLGLPVIFGIVQAHRGFIDVASTPGKGSEFRLYLPAKTPDAQDPLRRHERRG